MMKGQRITHNTDRTSVQIFLTFLRFGSRFFSLNGCYDSRWRKLAKEIAMESRMSSRIHEGVYAMLGGPNFETIAELKMLKICGVDAVGSLHYFLLSLIR